MSEWDGRAAVVTGASSGIGRATALAFAERGVRVVVGARREPLLVELVEEIREAGGEATHRATDVSVEEDVAELVHHAVETFGRLDFGANVAGTEGEVAGVAEMTVEQWRRVIDVNLQGTFLAMKHEARAMLEAGRDGAIVNVGSINSFLGAPGGSAYAASKHGQVGLTTSAAAELASEGIRVNLVCPGIVDTPMHRRLREEIGDDFYDSYLEEHVPQGRAGRPEEIADAILYLCSEQASYVTGSTVTPDGGLLRTL